MGVEVSRAAASGARTTEASAQIAVFDEFLPNDLQTRLLAFLQTPTWAFGAYSDPAPNASRYWYKHYAGYQKDGREARTAGGIERELEASAPIVADVWRRVRAACLPSHTLTRCYANGYPFGSEGGLHLDSNIASHFTAIYYPHLAWHPNYGGETVFFDAQGADIVSSVYPRPNRLVAFPGTMPHVARGISRVCPEMRVTLMFKTAPAQ